MELPRAVHILLRAARRMALSLGLAQLLGASVCSALTLGMPLAARVFGSILLILVMINV